MGVATLLLVDKGRADFAAECCLLVFDEVVTNAWAERDTIIDIGDGIMQGVQARITVKAFGEEPVVLAKSANRLGVLHIIVLAVSGIDPQPEFVLGPLLLTEHIAGHEECL